MASKKVSIQIPKPLIKGIILSFIAQIVVALIINQLLLALPFTPQHQEQAFIDMNHNNPVVWSTNYMQSKGPVWGYVDVYFATTLTFLLSGIVFAFFLPFTTWPLARVIKSSALIGFIFSVGSILYDALATQLIESLKNLPVTPFDLHAIPSSLLQAFMTTLFFVGGAWLASGLRKKTVPKSQPQKKISKQPA